MPSFFLDSKFTIAIYPYELLKCDYSSSSLSSSSGENPDTITTHLSSNNFDKIIGRGRMVLLIDDNSGTEFIRLRRDNVAVYTGDSDRIDCFYICVQYRAQPRYKGRQLWPIFPD